MDLSKAMIGSAALVVLVLALRRVMMRRARAGQPRVPRVGGVAVIRPPRLHHALLGLTAIPPTAIVGAFAWWQLEAGQVTPAGIAALALTFSVGVAAFLWAMAAELRRHVRVDATGLAVQGVVKRRSIAWRDVARLRYNYGSGWFYVVGRQGGRVWIGEAWAGVGDFAELALEHVPAAIIDADPNTREALEDAKAGFVAT